MLEKNYIQTHCKHSAHSIRRKLAGSSPVIFRFSWSVCLNIVFEAYYTFQIDFDILPKCFDALSVLGKSLSILCLPLTELIAQANLPFINDRHWSMKI